jgi:hypothetical protein
MVTQNDINVLSGKLVDYINSQKSNIILNNFQSPENIILNFTDLIGVQVNQVLIQNAVGDKIPLLK